MPYERNELVGAVPSRSIWRDARRDPSVACFWERGGAPFEPSVRRGNLLRDRTYGESTLASHRGTAEFVRTARPSRLAMYERARERETGVRRIVDRSWLTPESVLTRLQTREDSRFARREGEREAARAVVAQLRPRIPRENARLGPLVTLLGDDLGAAVLRLALNNGHAFAGGVAACVCTTDIMLDAFVETLAQHDHVPDNLLDDFRYQLAPARDGEWTRAVPHLLVSVEAVLRALARGRSRTVQRDQGDYYATNPKRRVGELRAVVQLLDLADGVHDAVFAAALTFPELDGYRHGAHLRPEAQQLPTPPRAAAGLALLVLAVVLAEDGSDAVESGLRHAGLRVASRIRSVGFDARNVPAVRAKAALAA